MSDTRGLLTLARLIEIKREEVDVYRADWDRLQQLLRVEAQRLEAMRQEETGVVVRMREEQAGMSEASGMGSLNATAMMEVRRYLAVLRGRIVGQESVWREIEQQAAQALEQLEQVYAQMRVLERVSERKRSRIQQEAVRRAYTCADEMEVTRMANGEAQRVGD